ncbi:MAG: hypothetical protein AB7U82_09915 [Blastocatellales bacterium]
MAKIERGRISGLHGMASFTSAELLQWAQRFEAQITDPKNTDDPKWLQRWADKMRRLAAKKQKAHAHKERQQ